MEGANLNMESSEMTPRLPLHIWSLFLITQVHLDRALLQNQVYLQLQLQHVVLSTPHFKNHASLGDNA